MGTGANRLKIRPPYTSLKKREGDWIKLTFAKTNSGTFTKSAIQPPFSVSSRNAPPQRCVSLRCGALRDDTENGCVAD